MKKPGHRCRAFWWGRGRFHWRSEALLGLREPLEDRIEQDLLLEFMRRARTSRGARALGAGDAADGEAIVEDARDARLDEEPCAHIPRLLLRPDEIRSFGINRERFFDLLGPKRVELLESYNGKIVTAKLIPPFEDVVVDLPGAEDHTLGLLRIDIAIGEDPVELTIAELLEAADAAAVSEEALWRHHDERLSPSALHLPTKAVEELGRRREIDDLHVVFGTELKPSFESRTRVFWTLPLEAMRQKEHEPAEAMPFILGRADELINDHLRRIGEIAKLRFPHHKCIGAIERVAVLEAEHAGFGKGAIVNLERSLVGRKMAEPRMPATRLRIEDDGVAMAEGASADVLSCEANTNSFSEEGADREILSGSPIHRLALLEDIPLLIEDEALEAGMRLEAFG